MKNGFKKAAVGLVTGLMSGVFGAGGGIAAVLSLNRLCDLDTKQAHATALSVMLPVTAAGAAIYLMKGGVDMQSLMWCTPGVVAGGFAGAKLTGKLRDRCIDNIFSLVTLAAGAWMALS